MKRQSIIKYFSVSIVCLSAVLTVMFAGCKKTDNLEYNIEKNVEKSIEKSAESSVEEAAAENIEDSITDGEYTVNVLLSGGSGKTTLKTPTVIKVSNEKKTIVLEYSSPNYDYMIVDGTKYLPINESGNSTFEIPVEELDGEISVIADTVAMSKPHEIEYTITFSRDDVGLSPADNAGLSPVASDNVAINNWVKNHKLTGKLERKYAEQYGVAYYDDKYSVLVINNTDYYLLTEDGDIPDDLPDEFTVINIPINNAYVVSSGSMDYFIALDALDRVKFTSFNDDDEKDEKLKEYIDSGKISYAGKYSAPDYEMLLAGDCGLVIENKMITHSMDVLEKMKRINMTAIIDYSSHESSPYGRMEWIKLYGILTGKEAEAEAIFNEKEKKMQGTFPSTGKSVAYFYITDGGTVVVRRNQDYIASLIKIAGGNYIFEGKSEYDGNSTMQIQKEAFLDEVLDCDYLIYNSTISGKLDSLSDLSDKFKAIENTKAYKEGNVYCTTGNVYLSVMHLPEIAEDFSKALNGQEVSEYIYKLK